MTDADAVHLAERRAVARAVAAVLALLSGVALLGVWTTDASDGPAIDVRGIGYGFHLAGRALAEGSVPAAVVAFLPVLLVVATGVAAALVAAEPARRRATALGVSGCAGAALLLLVVLGIGDSDDLAGAGTSLVLALGCCIAAGVLGTTTARARLDRPRR